MSSYQTALQKENFIHRADDMSTDAHVCVERTDNQLVDLVLAGDAFAFEEIFDRHKRLVAIIASRYFKRPEEVEEIVQIAFAKAFTELKNFQGKYDRSLSSWLVRITTNTSFDVLRSQRRKPERLNCELSEAEADALLQLTADTSLTAEKTLLDRDLAEKLLAMIPDEDRMLLQMLYSDEMSTVDIAEIFGWSRSNVKIKAWRARAAVRKVLKRFL
ncbi:MAG TPA: sigma-70 family RNA polymerase sigma factor [Pyrinomonadaceae bacterium]|nr:sigma-70 family RNA polymerase sigma factor [Acidobacteriota bacterium]HQZ94825.1 sigma-70 family RNA polymerase sigma factor [Pyrinomonadaceae bacterium]